MRPSSGETGHTANEDDAIQLYRVTMKHSLSATASSPPNIEYTGEAETRVGQKSPNMHVFMQSDGPEPTQRQPVGARRPRVVTYATGIAARRSAYTLPSV